MELEDKFTLIITTYNRYQYLLRLLNYYRNFGFPFSIIILDSSSDDISIHSDEFQRLFDHQRIIYKKYDSKIFIAEKIAKGIEDVSTPFSCLCADDDFILPIGIDKCVDFLEMNPDYSLAQGKFIVHWKGLFTNKFYWAVGYPNDHSVQNKDPLERFESHLLDYEVTFYAVHRTEVLKSIWKETSTNFRDWGLHEIFPSSLSMLMGKKAVLPVLFSSREKHDFSVDVPELINSQYSIDRIDLATNLIFEKLINLSRSNHRNDKKRIKGVLLEYKKNIMQRHEKKLFRTFLKLLRQILKYIGIDNILIVFENFRYYHSYGEERKRMLKSQDIFEINNIKETVVNFNTTNKDLNKTRQNQQLLY
ncbi:MAG: TIGR00180 family glycosyltransferase [Bacteroidales bacterium]|nr:TIGR00180 family glycosyltransferase [Bacteroidales bacterium]